MGFPARAACRYRRAAERAYAHQFVAALPQGYDTLVGERGYGLSGGQRQRIALARAMLRDPAILILDEATSAVDIQDELLIRKAIEEFAKNRTTFVISHSMASIQFADRIVLDGRRTNRGDRNRLRAQADFGPLSPAPRNSLPPRNCLKAPARFAYGTPGTKALAADPRGDCFPPGTGTAHDPARSRTARHPGLCSSQT